MREPKWSSVSLPKINIPESIQRHLSNDRFQILDVIEAGAPEGHDTRQDFLVKDKYSKGERLYHVYYEKDYTDRFSDDSTTSYEIIPFSGDAVESWMKRKKEQLRFGWTEDTLKHLTKYDKEAIIDNYSTFEAYMDKKTGHELTRSCIHMLVKDSTGEFHDMRTYYKEDHDDMKSDRHHNDVQSITMEEWCKNKFAHTAMSQELDMNLVTLIYEEHEKERDIHEPQVHLNPFNKMYEMAEPVKHTRGQKPDKEYTK